MVSGVHGWGRSKLEYEWIALSKLILGVVKQGWALACVSGVGEGGFRRGGTGEWMRLVET